MSKNINFSKVTTVLLFFFIAWMIVQRAPLLWDMFDRQGQGAPKAQVNTLQNEILNIPVPQKHLLVFWATWCAPCKVELARINNLVKSRALKADDVLAVSSLESEETVKAFVTENDYRFTVATDPHGAVAKLYKIAGTPTLLLIDETGKINWMTMGISPSLEVRLKAFFNN